MATTPLTSPSSNLHSWDWHHPKVAIIRYTSYWTVNLFSRGPSKLIDSSNLSDIYQSAEHELSITSRLHSILLHAPLLLPSSHGNLTKDNFHRSYTVLLTLDLYPSSLVWLFIWFTRSSNHQLKHVHSSVDKPCFRNKIIALQGSRGRGEGMNPPMRPTYFNGTGNNQL